MTEGERGSRGSSEWEKREKKQKGEREDGREGREQGGRTRETHDVVVDHVGEPSRGASAMSIRTNTYWTTAREIGIIIIITVPEERVQGLSTVRDDHLVGVACRRSLPEIS